jgi:hypothetical protein
LPQNHKKIELKFKNLTKLAPPEMARATEAAIADLASQDGRRT